MFGVILLSADGYYADMSGKVDWGPASDKQWLRSIILNEVVIVGHNTFEAIRDFDLLMALPKRWLVHTNNKIYGIPNAMRFCQSCQDAFPKEVVPTINFGGPKNMVTFPPDKIIVHKTYENLGSGLKLAANFFDLYEILMTNQEPEYEVITYVKKK